MSKYVNKTVGVVAVLSPFVLTTAVWAAGGGAAEEHHGVTKDQLLGLLFFTINFGLFVLVLRKFALPFVKEALHKRKETVVQALNEAKLAQAEADQVRREYEEKLAGLEAEQEALRTQALESAQREKARILEEAGRMAERARLEAQQIAEREVEQARRTLREDVAEQAVTIATELIRARLRPADQSRLVNDLVDEVRDASSR
jgi:F-type H+-transporting ATPase subunit b